jgi:MORN repeat
LGKPHGSGVMTYVNKTKYAGDFVSGKRDGAGKILDAEGKEVPGQGGVFIKNVLDPNGVIVEVTVLDRSDIPVQYSTVALNKFAAVRSHVDRIGTVMEWDEKQQSFSLVVNDGTAKVNVVGSMIDSSEDPKVQTSHWPLDGGARKVTARIR